VSERKVVGGAAHQLGDGGLGHRIGAGPRITDIAFYETLGYGDQDCIALGKRLDGQPDRVIKR
jgi:hypothetical protein